MERIHGRTCEDGGGLLEPGAKSDDGCERNFEAKSKTVEGGRLKRHAAWGKAKRHSRAGRCVTSRLCLLP